MTEFRVKGTLKETAEDVEITVEASSYKDAEGKANKMGILVSDVLAVDTQDSSTGTPHIEKELLENLRTKQVESWVGVLSPDWLRSNRRYALLILALISALITPRDVISMLIMLVPLYLLYELGIQLIVWISVSKVAGDDDNDAKTKSMQKQNRILKLAVCVFAGLLLGYFIFNSPNVPSLDTGEEIVEMSKQRTSKKITPSRVITPTRVSALDTGTVSDWVNANSDTRLSTAIVWVKELKKERGGRNLEPITHDKSGKENAIALMNLLSAVSATSEGYGDWSKTDLQNAQELIECINYQIKTKYMGTTYMYDPIRDVLFICDISKKQGLH